MNFQLAIDHIHKQFDKQSFGLALDELSALSPVSLWERNVIREAYFKGGDLAYKGKKLLQAISFFEGAKNISHTPEEVIQAEKRIYFTLFMHFQLEAKKRMEVEDFQEAYTLYQNTLNSFTRYPKEGKSDDKAWNYMYALIPRIKQHIQSCQQNKSSDIAIEIPFNQVADQSPPAPDQKENQAFSEPINLGERVAFKLSISTGLELYKEHRFSQALEEFEKALQIQQTDHLLAIIAKCRLGKSLVEELERSYGKTA